MKVLVGMSGGVDSSVAAAELKHAGHDVTGATMKLWGGQSDTGCCSVADVDDARRVAQQLDIPFHVFNFTEEFDRQVVDPYVEDHQLGRTPNPCVECNRHLKFDRFIQRASELGFDAIATGHHAQIVRQGDQWQLWRGADAKKDQSYVVHMLGQDQLARTVFPIGSMTKDDVRRRAQELSLRTADKPDSQDVCFISSTKGGRGNFLRQRIPLHEASMVDAASGAVVGRTEAIELVNVGQRRGLLPGRDGRRRYALSVDVAASAVTVGDVHELMDASTTIESITWINDPIPVGTAVLAQTSAHGTPRAAIFNGDRIDYIDRQLRVAPGQSVVLYDGDRVIGGAKAV